MSFNPHWHSTILAMSGLLAIGCTSIPKISGESRADDTLKSDVSKRILFWENALMKCEKIDSIQTQILKTNPIGTGKSEASRKYGSVEERWVVNLCGKSIPYSVTFTPDGQGGTYFLTSREKK